MPNISNKRRFKKRRESIVLLETNGLGISARRSKASRLINIFLLCVLLYNYFIQSLPSITMPVQPVPVSQLP